LVTFNETIFSREFDKDDAVCDLNTDFKTDAPTISSSDEDSKNSVEVSPPRPVGRPRKLPPSPPTVAPITSSPKSAKITNSKKRKRDEDLSKTSNKKSAVEVPDLINTELNGEEQVSNTGGKETTPQKGTDSTNETTKKDVKNDSTLAEITDPNLVNKSDTIVLFPCDPCGISFDKQDELRKHELVCKISFIDSGEKIQKIEEERDVIETKESTPEINGSREKCSKVGSGRDYYKKRKRKSQSISLEESCEEDKMAIDEDSKVKEEDKKPNPDCIKQELLSEALLSEGIDGGMVSLPMDSFLETVLTEKDEPLQETLHEAFNDETVDARHHKVSDPIGTKLHDAMDSFTANLKARSETSTTIFDNRIPEQAQTVIQKPSNSFTTTEQNVLQNLVKATEEDHTNKNIEVEPAVALVSESDDDLSISLKMKYGQTPKRVDFTQSNFFMKHAELIGKSVNGAGFKETNGFLPEGWKMKTFNEVKRFFLTPDFVVLKSPTAVIEYLRISINLSHDDLRSLSVHLKVAGHQFNRYLDDLYDDCVVLE